MGKNGYDAINGTETSMNFDLEEDIIVGVSLDQSDQALIRLSYKDQGRAVRAKSDFEALTNDLLSKWPTTRVVR